MKKDQTPKTIAVAALIIAIIGLSVGFAAMSTTLQINGTAEMNPATWDIRFQNLSAPTITGGASVLTAPTLTNTQIGTFGISLTKPGDSVTYTFDITNAGTINADLGSITPLAPGCVGTGANAAADATLVCNNISYTLVYTANGTPLAANDTLDAGQTRNVTLRLTYLSTATQLPTALVNINNLGITLVYVQR